MRNEVSAMIKDFQHKKQLNIIIGSFIVSFSGTTTILNYLYNSSPWLIGIGSFGVFCGLGMLYIAFDYYKMIKELEML